MSEYFVLTAAGERYGPASADILTQWASEGRIPNGTMVEEAGTGSRMPVINVPGFISTRVMMQPPHSENDQLHAGQWQNPMANPMAGQYGGHQYVNNNLVKAILSTLFCAMPIGIVAIVYAAQVDGHARRGDIASAQNSANKANIWANWSIGVAVALPALYLVAFAIIAAVSATGVKIK